MNDFTANLSARMDILLELFAQFLTFLLLVGAVIFFICYRRHKKRKQQENPNVANAPAASAAPAQKRIFDESEKNYDIFEDIIITDDQEHHILKYEYEQSLCMLDNVVENISGNGGIDLTFEPETDNEHDAETISVYLKGQKIGYVYKGKIRDTLWDWIRKRNPYRGYVNKINVAENKVTYKIGFYLPLSRYEHKEFPLVKLHKAANYDGTLTRWDNLSSCEVGEGVRIDVYGDTYSVCDYGFDEIGELGTSAIAYIEKSGCQTPVGVISSIDEEEEKAKIIIYLVQ